MYWHSEDYEDYFKEIELSSEVVSRIMRPRILLFSKCGDSRFAIGRRGMVHWQDHYVSLIKITVDYAQDYRNCWNS